MHTKLFFAIMVTLFPLYAQIYDNDESRKQQSSGAEDTVTDELPAPLPEGTMAIPKMAAAPTELAPSNGETVAASKKLAGIGAGLYFAGMGLSYGLSLPLFLLATNQEMAITSIITEAAATGFRVSGTTRNGVGAGIAFNAANNLGLKPDRNINWGFYKAGWAFRAVSDLSFAIVIFGAQEMDYAAIGTFMVIFLTTKIASDAMWTTGVINSLKYTKNAGRSDDQSLNISVMPVFSLTRKSAGAVATLSF